MYNHDMSDPSFTEMGRRLAALRKQVASQCVICGTPIVGTTKKRYCSNRCRVEAYVRRKREQQAREAD